MTPRMIRLRDNQFEYEYEYEYEDPMTSPDSCDEVAVDPMQFSSTNAIISGIVIAASLTTIFVTIGPYIRLTKRAPYLYSKCFLLQGNFAVSWSQFSCI